MYPKMIGPWQPELNKPHWVFFEDEAFARQSGWAAAA
jgi:hypothetical protein